MYDAVKVCVPLGRNYSRARAEILVGNSNRDLRSLSQVLQPIRRGVLRNDVELAVVRRKPDLNFAQEAAFAAARGQVEILLPIDVTGL